MKRLALSIAVLLPLACIWVLRVDAQDSPDSPEGKEDILRF